MKICRECLAYDPIEGSTNGPVDRLSEVPLDAGCVDLFNDGFGTLAVRRFAGGNPLESVQMDVDSTVHGADHDHCLFFLDEFAGPLAEY